MARDVRTLEVFRASDRLLFEVVAVIATVQTPSRFIFRDQLTRAALSVPLNLVEGSQRSTTREYGRYVEIATGSAAETRYLLSVLARLVEHDERLRQLEQDYDTLVRRLQALRSRLADLSADHRPDPGP
jgi:four helix bundle protein